MNIGNRSEICQSIIYYQISFSSHTTNNNCVCNTILVNNFIAKSMTCCLVTGAVSP